MPPDPPDVPELPAPDDADATTIGQGAFGRVLLVRDPVLDRDVALKELRPQAGSADATGAVFRSPELEARFIREARLTAGLEHPGIVPVHTLARRPDGSLYYTMRPVRGHTLAEVLRAAPTLAARLDLLDAFVDVCQAVAYAHSRGVLHRDLKPQNVMVGAFGETVLLDWGVATTVAVGGGPDEGGLDATRAGTVVGTPGYLAPEQARGEIDHLDERTDVWGLGAILSELVTGRRPYPQADVDALLDAVAHGPPHPIDGPPELASIVARAMAFAPADRYANALDLARDVRAWRAGELVGAHPYTLAERFGRQLSRHGRRIAAVGLGLVVLLVVAVVGSARFAEETRRARTAEATADERADEARTRLADILITRAEDAVAAGSAAEAMIYGAEALGIREDARARGALIAADSALLHTLDWHAPIDGHLLDAAWGPDALDVYVRGKILRFAADGTPLPSLDGLRGDGVELAAAADGRLAVTEDGGVAVFDPARSTEPITRAPSPVRPLDVAWVDGDRIAYAVDRGAVSVWSVSRGVETARWLGQPTVLRTVAARPDGRGVVSGSNGHDLAYWSPDDARPLRALADEGVGAFTLAISPDSRWVVAGGEVRGGDGLLREWDLDTGALHDRVPAHTAEIIRVRISPDGRWLVSSANDGSVKLWTFPKLRPIATLRFPDESILWVDFSPDASRVALVSQNGGVRVWRIAPAPGAMLPQWYDRAPSDVAWSPSGSTLAVVGEDEDVHLLDGHTERVFPHPLGTGIEAVAWVDDHTVQVGAYGLDALALDETSGAVVQRVPLANGNQLSPDRRWLIAVDERRAVLELRSVDGKEVRTVDCAPLSIAAVWWPDGSKVLAGLRGGGLVTIPPTGGACSRVGDLEARALAVRADGEQVIVATTDTLVALDGELHERWRVPGPRAASAVLYAPGGTRFYTTDWGGDIGAWRGADGAALATWRGHANRIWTAALSPDGRRLATVSGDHSARVWLLDALDEPAESVQARARRTTGLRVVDGRLRDAEP